MHERWTNHLQEQYAKRKTRLKDLARRISDNLKPKTRLGQSLEFEQATPFGLEFPAGLADLIIQEGRNPIDVARNAIMLGYLMDLDLVTQEQPDGNKLTIGLHDINPISNNRYKRIPREDIFIDANTAFRMGTDLESRQIWFESALSFYRRHTDMNVFLLTDNGYKSLNLDAAKSELVKRQTALPVIKPSDAPHISSPIPQGMRQVA